MRIAFAEDDRQLRTAVSRGLREAGYAVDQAGTGGQVLALVEGTQYDAVILDILIPEPDGIAVCRAIRTAGNRVPILMLTALDAVEQRIAGLDAGADDYVTKPFDLGELLARLRALTRRNVEEPHPRLGVADLVIDTARHEVRRAGRAVPLTAREYAFLLYMVRHAGRIVTRAELMKHVWDDSGSTYSNIIDVYASRLRRKIDDEAPVQLFTTVRGAGFMLAAPEPAPAAMRGMEPERG